jgi:hypothetical protein
VKLDKTDGVDALAITAASCVLDGDDVAGVGRGRAELRVGLI